MSKKKERIDGVMMGHNINKYIGTMKYYYYSIAWENTTKQFTKAMAI